MRTTNAMQLKARINNRAKRAGIPAQTLMQSYLAERLLDPAVWRMSARDCISPREMADALTIRN